MEDQEQQEQEQKEVQLKNTPIVYPINIIDVIIVAVCGIVLIYTAINGNPSETIIGGFMGYLGANIKNGMGQNSKTTTTKTTTTNTADGITRARRMGQTPGMWYEEYRTVTPAQPQEQQEEEEPEKEEPAPPPQDEKPKRDHSELNEKIKREMACATSEAKQPKIFEVKQ